MPDLEAPRCPNCDRPRPGRFCSHCGQKAFDHRRPLRELLGELQSEVFALDARIWKSLKALLFQPGRLTVEYNAGRRHAFMPPVRLYLLVSFFFFLAMPFANPEIVRLNTESSLSEATAEGAAAESEEGVAGDATGDTNDANDFRVEFPPRPPETGTVGSFFEGRFAQLEERYREPEKELNLLVSRRIPQTMFFLVPMLALLLKILFLRRGIFYIEHLVFAVHAHAFLFLVLLVTMLLREALQAVGLDPRIVLMANFIPLISLPTYLFLALRRVYRQGRFLTAALGTVAAVLYLLCSVLVLLAVLVVTLALV